MASSPSLVGRRRAVHPRELNEDQIVIAAEVMVASPDFGHLEPMVNAAKTELHAAGRDLRVVILKPPPRRA